MFREKILLALTARMPARAIDLDGRHYIERYHIGRFKRLRVTFYLHRYLNSDGDRAVHDHPWRAAIGIPLIGGYNEEVLTGLDTVKGWDSKMVRRHLFRWNIMGPLHFHRIAWVKPGSWTLFITINRFKGWGFFRQENGHVFYSQPYDVGSTKNWHEEACTGKLFRQQRGT